MGLRRHTRFVTWSGWGYCTPNPPSPPPLSRVLVHSSVTIQVKVTIVEQSETTTRLGLIRDPPTVTKSSRRLSTLCSATAPSEWVNSKMVLTFQFLKQWSHKAQPWFRPSHCTVLFCPSVLVLCFKLMTTGASFDLDLLWQRTWWSMNY